MPKIQGNRIFFSWEPHPSLLTDSSYWIEYIDLKEIRIRSEALLEAYLPIFLAFSFLGDVTFILPGSVAPRVLETWKKTCFDTSLALSKRPACVEFVAQEESIISHVQEAPESENSGLKETALLLGGGSESLLTLARLLKKGIAPILISLWGPGWNGSDPEVNEDRFTLEEKLKKQEGLRIVRIHTNIRHLFDHEKFKPYLRTKTFIIDAALFLPITLSAVLPVAEQLRVCTIVSGNEKENRDSIYSCSPEMAKNLRCLGRQATYYSFLEDLEKIKIIKELHIMHPSIAQHQYSCWKSVHERWCLKCEKCVRNYIIYKIIGVEPKTVGMDEEKLLQNLRNNIGVIKKRIRQDGTVRGEWSAIREEATNQNKKEIVNIINSFYKPFFLQRFFK